VPSAVLFGARELSSSFAKIQNTNRDKGSDLWRELKVLIFPAISGQKWVLTYLFGIGPTRARQILAETKVSPDTRIKDLTEAEVAAIREYISKHYKVEGDLRREVQMNIKRLIEIGSYRGYAIAATCR
jgi:ribosomal protein uS13